MEVILNFNVAQYGHGKVNVKNRTGMWRDENGVILVDGEEIGRDSTISGLRNGTPAYNFWIEDDVLKLQAINSTNLVKTPFGEIKDGTLNISKDCKISIGTFEFRVEFNGVQKESKMKSLNQNMDQNKSQGYSL
jgi:hypothetical protein